MSNVDPVEDHSYKTEKLRKIVFSIFYTLNALVIVVLLVYGGMQLSVDYTERNLFGFVCRAMENLLTNGILFIGAFAWLNFIEFKRTRKKKWLWIAIVSIAIPLLSGLFVIAVMAGLFSSY